MTVNRQAIDWGSWGLGIFAMSFGTTLALQDLTRMSSPGWQLALSIPGIDADAWGMYLIVCGLGILVSILFRAWKTMGCFAVAVSFALFARTIAAVAALEEPHASGTAPQVFLLLTALYLAHGITMLRRP